MKLVKNVSQNDDSGQCGALTNSGSRCSRKAARDGYCKQHYKKLKAQGLVMDRKGNELIEQMPEIPEEFGKTGRQRWQVYCQYLIDQERLYQSYLFGLMNLCYLEEQLEETKESLNNHGAVNFYENAIQRNGYASHFDKLLNHIRSLRSDYSLTVASDKSVGNASKEASPKQNYKSRKEKAF